jgi:hypothetical protein
LGFTIDIGEDHCLTQDCKNKKASLATPQSLNLVPISQPLDAEN